jgi:AraC-type DNA-binding domain-containing proteins
MLTEVAEEAGFGSTASLFRVFRSLRGITPAQFRKSSMQKTDMPS